MTVTAPERSTLVFSQIITQTWETCPQKPARRLATHTHVNQQWHTVARRGPQWRSERHSAVQVSAQVGFLGLIALGRVGLAIKLGLRQCAGGVQAVRRTHNASQSQVRYIVTPPVILWPVAELLRCP